MDSSYWIRLLASHATLTNTRSRVAFPMSIRSQLKRAIVSIQGISYDEQVDLYNTIKEEASKMFKHARAAKAAEQSAIHATMAWKSAPITGYELLRLEKSVAIERWLKR